MFCLYSYSKGKSDFTHLEIIEYITKSSKYCSITKKPEDILHDYMQAVNLIKINGLSYTFIHRSFQEYFVAYAIMRIIPDNFSVIMNNIADRFTDSVILLCYEINNKMVFDRYIKPLFENLQNENFFKSNNNRYFYLNKIGVEINTRILNGKPNLSLVTEQQDGKLLEFIVNARKIMSMKNDITLISSIFTNKNMLSVISKLLMNTDKKSDIKTKISFDPDEIQILSHKNEENISNEVYNKVLLDVSFDDVEKLIKNEINEITEWYNKQIKLFKKQEKSLEEILGF